MSAGVDELVESLLYEGYALYPYTPQATKNATPTPFGIVYAPACADGAATFDRLVVECLADAPPGAQLTAQLRFLQPRGPRHEAVARSATLPAARIGGPDMTADLRFDGDDGADGPALELRATLTQEPVAGDGRVKVTLTVRNHTPAPAGLDRAGALRHAAISTHPVLRLSAGRFASPLEVGARCHSVNTWPVLASPGDDVVLGAAIVLPDHPQLAPESLGGLFDSTEIEEALLLHVQVLSDDERAAIAGGDPAVAEMVARAVATAPEELLALHGRVTVRDPVTTEPPVPSAAVGDPTRGEDQVTVEGVTFRRGGTVVLRPGADADLHARMLDGRRATIERIFVDVDGKAHLGVTVDGDPGQQLLRETNRLLFFFAPEVEVVP